MKIRNPILIKYNPLLQKNTPFPIIEDQYWRKGNHDMKKYNLTMIELNYLMRKNNPILRNINQYLRKYNLFMQKNNPIVRKNIILFEPLAGEFRMSDVKLNNR